MLRAILPVLALLLLGGCAATQDAGRSRLVADSEIGAVYSDVELQAKLALTPSQECPLQGCVDAQTFHQRVLQLGERLKPATVALAAESKMTPPKFNISVPAKNEMGTLSSAAGNIVLFDGIRQLELTDPALAFLLAREMGHVMAKHHEENTATGLAVSLAVAILFPVTGILQGMEVAYTTSTLASTATSFAGARMVRAIYADDQQREADDLALQIMQRAGWTVSEVVLALEQAQVRFDGSGWIAGVRDSQQHLMALVTGPPQLDSGAASFALQVEAEPPAAVSGSIDEGIALKLDGPRIDTIGRKRYVLDHGGKPIAAPPVRNNTVKAVANKQGKPVTSRKRKPVKRTT